MNCKEAQKLLELYLDQELPLSERRIVEGHLQNCSVCAQALASLRALSEATRAAARQPAPANLARRIRASLSATAGEEGGAGRWQRLGVNMLSAAAAAALTALMFTIFFKPDPRPTLVDEVVAAHVRSQMAEHLTDIASSDRHAVKPWFSGRLDFSPPVKDLSDTGFALAGGRLDYVRDRSVAALVYKRRQHMINLFAWPATDESQTFEAQSKGYYLRCWNEGGLRLCAVSDLNPEELRQFSEVVRQRV